MCANSVTDAASLPLPALSVKNVLTRKVRTKVLSANNLNREAKDKAPLSANSEVILASLKERALLSSLSKAKLEQ